MKLTNCQEKAVTMFASFVLDNAEPFMLITGGAGVGKTTLIKELTNKINELGKIASLVSNQKINPSLRITSTTNQANKPLQKVCSDYDIRTIYSLLGLKPKPDGKGGLIFKRDQHLPIDLAKEEILIIDEVSYIDKNLFSEILDAVKYNNCKVLFIGSKNQLVVGDPVVFDITTPYKTHLSEPVRQKPKGSIENPITTLTRKYEDAVETGKLPSISPASNIKIITDDAVYQKELAKIDWSLISNCVDNKILAYTNERVNDYNEYIQDSLGLASGLHQSMIYTIGSVATSECGRKMLMTDSTVVLDGILLDSTVEYFDVTFYRVKIEGYFFLIPEDKDYLKYAMKIAADSENWKVFYNLKNLATDIRPYYSSTVHKAQGSTMKKVFIDLYDIGRCHDPVQFARLMHVATSRPTDEIIFYGELPNHYKGQILFN